MAGYVKLWRSLLRKPIWYNSTPEHKSVLMALMMMAEWQPRSWEWKGEKINLQPGQFVTSVASITQACGRGVTTKSVRDAIERFQQLDFLTNESTKTGRLISIINWSLYQTQPDDETGGQQFAQSDAPKSGSMGQRGADKRANKRANKRADSSSSITPETSETGANKRADAGADKRATKEEDPKKMKNTYPPAFETWWATYPRHVEKADAFRAYRARVKEGIAEDDLLKAARNYAAACKRRGQAQEYIKHPATFLGPKRAFEDFLSTPTENKRERGEPKCDPTIERLRAIEEETLASPTTTTPIQ